MIKKASGRRIKLVYELRVDGKIVKSVGANRALWYRQGERTIPVGLRRALAGMRIGQTKSVVLAPKDGYGVENPKLFLEFPKNRFPGRDHLIGRELRSARDGACLGVVKEVRSTTLLLNLNHPYAGKTLQYDVRILGVEGRSQ